MSEHAPTVPNPYDLVVEAAEGANIAHSALQHARAARATFEAAESFGIKGVTITPKAYATVDSDIQKAGEAFEVYGSMVAAVMPPQESDADAAASAIPRPSGEGWNEQRKESRQRHSNFLFQVLTRADENGLYEDVNLATEIKAASELTHSQWVRSLDRLRKWDIIATKIGQKGSITSITVDCGTADLSIGQGKISPLPGDVTATQMIEAKRQLSSVTKVVTKPKARKENTDPTAQSEAAADTNPSDAKNNPAAVQPQPENGQTDQAAVSPPKPKRQLQPQPLAPTPTHPSKRVRSQVSREAQKGTGQVAQDPGELSESEHEILELRNSAQSLTEEQHYMLEPLAHVALAFLDTTILAGTSPEGLGKQLIEKTGLPPKTVVDNYGIIKNRKFLEFVEVGDVRQPVLTQGFRHFLRNVIDDVKEHS